jgi:hypothetical protein
LVKLDGPVVGRERSLSLSEFLGVYRLHEPCVALVLRWRWPPGSICPRRRESRHREFLRHCSKPWRSSPKKVPLGLFNLCPY